MIQNTAKITFSPDISGQTVKTLANRLQMVSKLNTVLVSNGIEGASINQGVGYWKGNLERSYTVTIAGIDQLLVEKIANEIKNTFSQEAVMVEQSENIPTFI